MTQQGDSRGRVEAELLDHRRGSRCEDKKQVRPGRCTRSPPIWAQTQSGHGVRRRLSAPLCLEPEPVEHSTGGSGALA